MKLNPHKTGLSVGLFVAAVHTVWSLLVALGFAQTLMTWSMNWHMVSGQWSVGAFNLTSALTLIVVSAVVGYVLGYAFATIWNQVHK
ncbi:MAG TPA: hypothetical protein VFA93_02695 [Patescibacteria group bacterium]|nr:hypothetical protein [Patescibacteria group bacterium]